MNKILVVVDMQNDFIDGALGTPEAQAIVGSVVKKIDGFTGDIFVTFDTHEENYMDTAEGRALPVPHCIKGTHGWELNDEVYNALAKKGYTTVIKPTFGSVALPDMISCDRDMTDTEIEIIGVCTDICVVSNALLLKAHFPETKISVDAGCCAGVTPEAHSSALEVMRSCQIKIGE